MVGTENAITEAELGMKMDLSHEEVVHMAELTEEEKVIEKKLRKRIDALIMPLAILVYLMNYIDRYVCLIHNSQSMLMEPATIMLQRSSRVSKRISISTIQNTKLVSPFSSLDTFSCRYLPTCF